MNDSIDDWLNSLGFDAGGREASIPASSDTVPVLVGTVQPVAVVQQPQEESSQTFSAEDFNDILADNGFQEPESTFDEAEEIEEQEEEEENTEEERDLDAEEDADWQEAVDSGGIVPVEFNFASLVNGDIHFHMPNGDMVDVPIVHERALEAVQSVNEEDYPEHNPDEQLAPEPLIPLNSPTLLMNTATSRFSGTEWYKEIQRSRIILAGLGGIGSWVSIQLARMNPSALFMYDDDIVEIANMSGQLYCQNDVGKAKVDAMSEMIHSYTTIRNTYAIKDKFKITSEAGDIMICGFDNMAARKTFFEKWVEHVFGKPEEERYKCLYLDGRLSINVLQVFCIQGDDYHSIDQYRERYLFSDAEADATVCSLKQTTYLACMIGSVIVNLFTNFIANTLKPVIPYDLPFFTEYDAQNMIFKTIK